jgi:hypothetical protein
LSIRKSLYLYYPGKNQLTEMEILEGDALYKTLFQRYSKNPNGWSFTFSKAPTNGFFDAFVSGPDDSWRLKLDTIFKPSPFVLGAKIDMDQSKLQPLSPFPFGFRRLGTRDASALLEDQSGDMNRLLSFLGSSRPVAPTAGGSYIQGPFIFANRKAIGAPMTNAQENVDAKLSQELLKVVRRRYPSYF